MTRRDKQLCIVLSCVLWAFGFSRIAVGQVRLPAGLDDFYMKGTQEGALNPSQPSNPTPIVDPTICSYCHTDFVSIPAADIHKDWRGSMMAQATRDPLFQACMQIANAEVTSSGDMCIRCHSPKGWLEGRSQPTDGSALTSDDYKGVSCNMCHRLVSVQARSDEDPSQSCNNCDAAIRQALLDKGDLPTLPGNGSYIVDPHDRRRGPFSDAICRDFHDAEFRTSFFTDSAVCGTCHDISNPLYTRVGSQYVLGPIAGDVPPPPQDQVRHPTGEKYDMFPIERTYSEWLASAYAVGGIDSGGRFGGNDPIVGSCESCHMPRGRGDGVALMGCVVDGAPLRLNVPMHFFSGANTWIPDVVTNLYPADVDAEALAANKARNASMLHAAASLQLSRDPDGRVRIRITNETGHKLPTGYNEGRRMWLHVTFRDCMGTILEEHGHYDDTTAVLTTADTKVYEARFGVDAAVAARTGLPVGESFHFALNNVVYFDNRIPPRGFANAGFAAVQASPVGYAYADGQYWDDTTFQPPASATVAAVEVFYQTASKAYVEFLRDNNPLPPADPGNMGQVVYNQWLITGKCAPVRMAARALYLQIAGDLNSDGQITAADVPLFVNVLLGSAARNSCAIFAADMNGDGTVDGDDIALFVALMR